MLICFSIFIASVSKLHLNNKKPSLYLIFYWVFYQVFESVCRLEYFTERCLNVDGLFPLKYIAKKCMTSMSLNFLIIILKL